jgi:hypothetical protein
MSNNGEKAELQPGDENAIRSLLARLYDAWARGDGVAYAVCFAEEFGYITFNGMHLRGRTENAKLHAALFRRANAGSGPRTRSPQPTSSSAITGWKSCTVRACTAVVSFQPTPIRMEGRA